MNWFEAPLGNIVDANWGNTSITKKSYVSEGFPAYSATGQDGLLPHSEHSGDGIVLSAIGARCGKCFFAQGKWTSIKNTITLTDPNSSLADIKYLFYYLNQDGVWPKRGGGQPFIALGDVRQLRIPLPPPSEQRRIVEILDQADALRRKRADADALAERILPALFYKMFGDPATNPMGWDVRPLGDFLGVVNRRDPRRHPDETFSYIDIAAVDGATGQIVKTKLLPGGEAPSRARQVVKAGDTIVSTVRPYLRATAMVPASLDHQICSTGFCVMRPRHPFGSGFLYGLSRLQWFTDQLTMRAKGASYPAVSDADIQELMVPLPDNEDAHKLFESQLHLLLTVQRHIEHSRRKTDDLFQTLLQEGFNGRLTRSWREAHMEELLEEMELQARELGLEAVEA